MTTANVVKLGHGRKGLSGTVVAVGAAAGSPDSSDIQFDVELERRLLEIGLVEGAHVEILHEGFIGRDPIAIRVDSMRVALRRREADAVLVQIDGGAGMRRQGGRDVA